VAFIIVAIIVVLAGAVVFLLATARRRATTGHLSRETRQRDASAPASAASPADLADEGASEGAATDESARARADEARRAIASGGGLPVPAGERGVTKYVPVDEEELGVTRRQFFNRGILTATALGIGSFGAAALAFLWPSGAGGFGGKVNIGSLDDINKAIASKQPYYNAAAKVYIQPYPKADIAKAAKVAAYVPPILAGMKLGYVALYQKCVHLGCRVPWCQTSQWFECPCHGSKYNRVGEKRGGPAPRGLDRFALSIAGGSMLVDTAIVYQGPPIGTDTTGQGQEGAACV
jgi:cytochrome b6-f complex iron-sulfur subunit